jgi:hypothetical protein
MSAVTNKDAREGLESLGMAVFCGCAHHSGSLPVATSAAPIDQAGAISIAKRVVTEREKWRRVDCEAWRIDTGWRIFVCPKPIKMIGPMVFMTMDENGQLTSYERFYNTE